MFEKSNCDNLNYKNSTLKQMRDKALYKLDPMLANQIKAKDQKTLIMKKVNGYADGGSIQNSNTYELTQNQNAGASQNQYLQSANQIANQNLDMSQNNF